MKPFEFSTAFDGKFDATEWKKGYRKGYLSAVEGIPKQTADTKTKSYKSGYDYGYTIGACDSVC